MLGLGWVGWPDGVKIDHLMVLINVAVMPFNLFWNESKSFNEEKTFYKCFFSAPLTFVTASIRLCLFFARLFSNVLPGNLCCVVSCDTFVQGTKWCRLWVTFSSQVLKTDGHNPQEYVQAFLLGRQQLSCFGGVMLNTEDKLRNWKWNLRQF